MLYNRSLLLIDFIHSSLYLLIPYLYLPPSPPDTGTTSLFSVSVSLFLLCYIHLLVLFFRLNHILNPQVMLSLSQFRLRFVSVLGPTYSQGAEHKAHFPLIRLCGTA